MEASNMFKLNQTPCSFGGVRIKHHKTVCKSAISCVQMEKKAPSWLRRAAQPSIPADVPRDIATGRGSAPQLAAPLSWLTSPSSVARPRTGPLRFFFKIWMNCFGLVQSNTMRHWFKVSGGWRQGQTELVSEATEKSLNGEASQIHMEHRPVVGLSVCPRSSSVFKHGPN